MKNTKEFNNIRNQGVEAGVAALESFRKAPVDGKPLSEPLKAFNALLDAFQKRIKAELK